MLRIALAFAVALGASLSLGGCNQERNESIRLMNKGIAYYKRDKIVEAIDHFAQAAQVDPSNDRAFFYQGLLQYQKRGDFDDARKSIQRAIEINGDDFEYHYHLGVVLSRAEQWKQAVDAFAQAIKLKADHAESHLRQGMALEQTGQYDRAQEAFVAAVKADPRLPETYNALGNLYRRFDQMSHAAQVFKNGIENNPQFALNYHDLGLVYQAQKRFDDAIKQFEQAQKLDPGSPSALFNLGMTYAANDDPQRAIQQLKVYLTRRTAAEDAIRVQIAQDMISRLEAAANAP